MSYVFVSLGRLESCGIRLGGAGLGNILFPWARSIVYSKRNKSEKIQTTWRTVKVGTFLRRERDKRMYFDLFSGKDGISGFKKFLLLNFSNKVKKFSGMDGLFESFKDEHSFVHAELMKIINPCHILKINGLNKNSIAIHIRMGDFETTNNEQLLRDGILNYRLPMKWYVAIINKIRMTSNLPIYIFSDACDKDLRDVLSIRNCTRSYFGSSIADMIALSRCKVLVASGSTFSMWGSFLGQIPTIWFPGQLRQKVILNHDIFEGEIDYLDELPSSIVKLINND